MSRGNVDWVVVDRIVSGNFALADAANQDERIAVINGWKAKGLSLTELARATNWNVHRLIKQAA